MYRPRKEGPEVVNRMFFINAGFCIHNAVSGLAANLEPIAPTKPGFINGATYNLELQRCGLFKFVKEGL